MLQRLKKVCHHSVVFETFKEEGFFFFYFLVIKSSEKADTVERYLDHYHVICRFK